jgi:hypothetical protein
MPLPYSTYLACSSKAGRYRDRREGDCICLRNLSYIPAELPMAVPLRIAYHHSPNGFDGHSSYNCWLQAGSCFGAAWTTKIAVVASDGRSKLAADAQLLKRVALLIRRHVSPPSPGALDYLPFTPGRAAPAAGRSRIECRRTSDEARLPKPATGIGGNRGPPKLQQQTRIEIEPQRVRCLLQPAGPYRRPNRSPEAAEF